RSGQRPGGTPPARARCGADAAGLATYTPTFLHNRCGQKFLKAERHMSNRDRDVAHLYHESTKLFYLDLQRKPPAYKRYRALLPLPLPTEISSLAVPTLEAVAATVQAASPAQVLDLTTLARLLFYSAGRIRTRTFAGAGEVAFRAAASAGGLYPIEAYIVCGD